MRSGRLHEGVSQPMIENRGGKVSIPCRCKDVDAVETLSTVHLSEHLVDDSVGDSSRIVTTEGDPSVSSSLSTVEV